MRLSYFWPFTHDFTTQNIPLIIFSVETRIFFRPLKNAYNLSSQKSKPVYILLIVCSANQCTGFFIIRTSVTKELNRQTIFLPYTFFCNSIFPSWFLVKLWWYYRKQPKKNTSESLSEYLRKHVIFGEKYYNYTTL